MAPTVASLTMVHEFTLRPIGVVRSEHTVPEHTPAQPQYAPDCVGRIEIAPEFAEGLIGIEGFSHVYVLYWLHVAAPAALNVRPLLGETDCGIFATRSPNRPNPLGMSLVELTRREGNVLHIRGVDMLDGTPVVDLKPYAPRFDAVANVRGGWTEQVDAPALAARGRRGYVPPLRE